MRMGLCIYVVLGLTMLLFFSFYKILCHLCKILILSKDVA